MKARVEEVTERARSRWLGVFRTGKNKLGRVLGDGVSSPSSIELAEKPAMEVLPGQLVSVEPITCGEEKKAPRGKIVEVLGYPDEPHVDMEAVIRKYGLSVEFPASVLRELETLPQTPSPGELARREDWTDRTVITIDPASARDFDDAISITATPSGWTLAARGRRNIRRNRFSSPDADMKARVEEVTERARSRWLGVFRTGKNKLGRVLGDGVSSPSSIELAEKPAMEVLPGQLVSVEPITCGEEKKAPRGKIVEVLGYPDEPHVDMEAVIRKYGLSVEFPASVLRELETLPQTPSPGELARREDWTDRTVITIDPASARDFDDAISITATPSGWTLAVHIADVSHFVKPGGSLDGEALRRGNSTYLPDRVLPMLPPRLSDDLCSLRPDVVRLTKVCEMKFDKKGKMLRARFADAFIRSKARLTYQEAFAMLKGNDKGEVPSTVREAWNLASILRRNRYAKGALDLDFPEVRAVMDKDGRVTGIITEEYDESHQLIEECMLAANEAVALALKNGNRPTIYRVHEEPDSAKLFEFGQLCRLYGHPVHDIDQRQYLNELMKSIKGSPDEQLLKLALLKSLMRARYDTEPLGHYGLATPNYCHFTSPIRRYADLVVHRSLNPLLANPPKGAKGAGSTGRLEEDAEHISETERISASAEKDANRMKLFEWLEGQCYADHPEVHEALVTETRHFGVLLEIPRLQIKGLVKPDKLPGGRWVYEAFASRWKNDHGSVLCAGLRVPVIPVKVDREQQWADFAIVSREKPRQTGKTAFPAKQEKGISGRGRRNR